MLVLNNYFYVANTDGLYRYHYYEGAKHLNGKGEKIVGLSVNESNDYWTQSIITNAA